MSLEAGLQRVWYGSRWLSLPLRPFAWVFRAAVAARRGLYRWRILPAQQAGVPVVVVGNLTVGGTGKTPIAAWLARQLTLRGHRVGVVLRGYGGRSRAGTVLVDAASDPDEVGDEAVLHAGRRPHVVVVGADRVAAARRAAEQGAQIVVCDDGLQHLRLARDCEIAVVDGRRGLGNGLLLPAGPLREPRGRLGSVDAAVLHAGRRPHVVVVGADRVAAARQAAEQGAQVVVCDDGLQHLRLARDCEIAVVDGRRGLGNGLFLPAGPLREPRGRLGSVDAVVLTVRGAGEAPRERAVEAPLVAVARLTPGAAVNLMSGEQRTLAAFQGTQLHAVAGIGHPEAFFGALRAAGLEVVAHALPDHAPLDPLRLPFPKGSRVLMTGKDAVKCRKFAGADWWYVELEVELEPEASRSLLARVLERTGLTGAGDNLG